MKQNLTHPLSAAPAHARRQELAKKCQACVEIIRVAKERQAAEANRNATSLLEELAQEDAIQRQQKCLAAKKRDKKKKKRQSRQQKDEEESGDEGGWTGEGGRGGRRGRG